MYVKIDASVDLIVHNSTYLELKGYNQLKFAKSGSQIFPSETRSCCFVV